MQRAARARVMRALKAGGMRRTPLSVDDKLCRQQREPEEAFVSVHAAMEDGV